MKIEASKNHSTEQRRDSKNVYKSESTVFDRTGSSKISSPAPAQSSGAFAKILEEARREKNDSSTDKALSADSDPQSPKTEREEKALRLREEKSEEKNSREEGGDADAETGENGGQNPLPMPVRLGLNSPAIAENAAAARAILHVADLERIISTIRSQTFQNQKQILIALKNSVLQGLQIRLTVTENGKIKAEFLALSEEIKRQLERRENELEEILKNRSPLFSAIEIKTPNAAEKE